MSDDQDGTNDHLDSKSDRNKLSKSLSGRKGTLLRMLAGEGGYLMKCNLASALLVLHTGLQTAEQ